MSEWIPIDKAVVINSEYWQRIETVDTKGKKDVLLKREWSYNGKFKREEGMRHMHVPHDLKFVTLTHVIRIDRPSTDLQVRQMPEVK